MTALLEFKQRLKDFYGEYEIYVLPVLKFVLALAYFFWINGVIGFSERLTSPFIVLILALFCAILPANMIVWFGFVLIIGNCYSLGIEVAAFAAVLILVLQILFLRFSKQCNVITALTPLGFVLRIPALVPIAGGLLSTSIAAFSGGCGVIFYYFLQFLGEQSAVLSNADTEVVQKIKLLADGLMKNEEMWLTVLAFAAVILLVSLIRTRSIDYAWRIAIVVGGVTYILVMLAGGLFLDAQVNIGSTAVFTILAILLGLVVEFFAFGGDYTRTEKIEYEDDEYFYYVKAVPKVSIAASKRKIKKINGSRDQEPAPEPEEDPVVEYANPIFEEDSWEKEPEQQAEQPEAPAESAPEEPVEDVSRPDMDTVDFEKKLEESLKDL